MRQFDLNKLEVDQIMDQRLDTILVGDAESLLLEDEWTTVTDEEFEAAIATQRLVLQRVNQLLRSRGIGVEFCETDLVHSTDFILVNRDETETEFADRIFG